MQDLTLLQLGHFQLIISKIEITCALASKQLLTLGLDGPTQA